MSDNRKYVRNDSPNIYNSLTRARFTYHVRTYVTYFVNHKSPLVII